MRETRLTRCNKTLPTYCDALLKSSPCYDFALWIRMPDRSPCPLVQLADRRCP